MPAQVGGQQLLADYKDQDQVGYEGQIASNVGYENSDGLRNATAGELPFGRAVCRGVTDLQSCTLPVVGQQLVGITTNLQNFGQTATQVGAPVGTVMGILKKGQIWVRVAVAVTPISIPLVTIATGLITAGTAVAGTTYAIPNSRFVTSAAANGFAILELNGHGGVVA
jgi:hypothetical protein